MRTTLNLDDDVLAIAKSLAVRQKKPVGEVVSAIFRKGLAPSDPPRPSRNGITLFPVREGSGEVTPEIIEQLLYDEP
ncbi:CopG family transcriptional regulator [Akkermansiaceae bacterium]|nr:CopG family transcriptional regulator [Akkermansiaceae bacterium]